MKKLLFIFPILLLVGCEDGDKSISKEIDIVSQEVNLVHAYLAEPNVFTMPVIVQGSAKIGEYTGEYTKSSKTIYFKFICPADGKIEIKSNYLLSLVNTY